MTDAVLVAYGLLEVVGNAVSDISVNFWIGAFETGAANFTIIVLSNLFFVLQVVPVTAFLIWKRSGSVRLPVESINSDVAVSSLDFRRRLRDLLCSPSNLALLVGITMCDVLINVFGTYAAGHLPVLIQVVLKSIEPMLCWILSCLVWRSTYVKLSWLLILPCAAIFVCAGGVVADTWIAIQEDSHRASAPYLQFWINMYALRVCFSALYNVVQGTFMRRNTLLFEGDTLLLGLIALSFDACVSAVLYLMVGPFVDSWSFAGWGSSPDAATAWSNLAAGIRCVFTPAACPTNIYFALLTNAMWGIVYVVDTFLNRSSPALNSLFNMLSSPLATLAIIAFPALDYWGGGATVHRSPASIGYQVGGAALILLAVVIFYSYERKMELAVKVHGAVMDVIDEEVGFIAAQGDVDS